MPITEKRSYYRINDLVGLTYRVIPSGENPTREPGEVHDMGNSLVTLLAEIDREFNQLTNILWQENPTAARSLGLLNRKLALIADHALGDEERTLPPGDMLMVNISGSGIAFRCEEAIPKGTRLQLTLTLKPSHVSLELTGTVVGCEEKRRDSKKPYWLRVAFEEGNGATQEQLIQHIVQKQYAQIKEEHLTDENNAGKPDAP